MVGALLGDFAKADVSALYPPEVAQEIMLHRQIDRFTDSHPIVRAALNSFAAPHRRFAGIILDVFYDHMLTRRWAAYSVLPQREFVARFYRALAAHESMLPERLRGIMHMMIEQDWLGSYEELSGVELAVRRISQRLSRNGHLLRDGLGDLRDNYGPIAAGFDEFFPELMQFVDVQRASRPNLVSVDLNIP
ncbi:MAG: ACP phosphodiesterase [Pseudomonadota bacterium]